MRRCASDRPRNTTRLLKVFVSGARLRGLRREDTEAGAYLDTVFSRRRIPMLLADLERLPPGLIPEPACVEVRRLAVVVEDGQHLYPWSCGD
jgi:hypothetical protein